VYTETNYQTKKQLKDDVSAGKRVTLFAPGLGAPKVNGTEYVEGPHYPAPHKWYASVIMIDGIVTKVK